VCPLLRRGARHSPRQDRLHTLEQVLGDQGLEVTTLRVDAVLRYVHDPGVEAIAQQHADRLRGQRPTATVGQAPCAGLLEQLFLGVPSGRVLLERASHERCALGLAIRLLPIPRGAFR